MPAVAVSKWVRSEMLPPPVELLSPILPPALIPHVLIPASKPTKAFSFCPVPSSSRVTAVVSRASTPDLPASPVAAILSDEEQVDFGEDSEDDFNVQVSDYKHRHLRFDCVVHGANHETKDLNVFLDCGEPYVLIHSSLVQSLGLKQRRLPRIEKFEVATRNPIPTSVTHFVWLRLSIPVSNWTSRKVMALVSPSLNMPLLLGLPWLAKNRLVTDYEERTCVCKDNNVDILIFEA
jgi:hypothetical protein